MLGEHAREQLPEGTAIGLFRGVALLQKLRDRRASRSRQQLRCALREGFQLLDQASRDQPDDPALPPPAARSASASPP